MRKNKLLICALALSMVLTVLPGMTSVAAEAEGETDASVSELQDENVQRLEEVTAMDEDGSIYEIEDTDGTVNSAETSRISTFALRMASMQVVNFNKNGSAVTYYTDEINGGTGYTNGAYGADAAYLGTTSDGRIRFMISGVTGTVNATDVQLVDYNTVANNVSYYQVSGGKLYHYISQNLNNAPSSSVNNGPAPSYLDEGVKYFSYDGHYFYTDYSVMLSDYQNGANGASAVNAGNPFYNYFQFLNMTTSTAYSAGELDSILNTAMTNAGIDPGSSKLTGTGNSFVNYQNTYSVNALLSLGIAVNESGWGRSNICLTKNNIFGLNAADSATENADSFASIDACIRDFMANWMAGGYLDSSDWRNNGEYLGSKAGGINVRYASDPYWGEKAAAHAWNLDTLGGSKDHPAAGDAPEEPLPETPVTGGDTPAEEPTPEIPVTDGDTPTGGTTPDTPATGGDTPAEEPTPDMPVTGGDTPTGGTTPDTPATGGDTPAEEPIPETPVTGGDTSAGNPAAETTPGASTPPANNTLTETTAGTGSSENVQSTESSGSGQSQEQTAAKTEGTNPPVSVQAVSAGGQDSTNSGTVTKSPKTGDSADAVLWIALLGGSVIVLITASAVLVRKKAAKQSAGSENQK